MNTTQLALPLAREAWQMTLAEFTATMIGGTRPKPAGDIDNVGTRPIDLRLECDRAYVRVQHKRAIRRNETRRTQLAREGRRVGEEMDHNAIMKRVSQAAEREADRHHKEMVRDGYYSTEWMVRLGEMDRNAGRESQVAKYTDPIERTSYLAGFEAAQAGQ